MICPKCQTDNSDNSKFCVKCGNDLKANNEVNNEVKEEIKTEEKTEVKVETSNVKILEYFYIMLAVILKPFTAFQEELKKFESFKNSAIVSGIIAVIATIITLIKTIFNAIKVKNYWTGETSWVWSNLKEVNYFKVIGTNLLIYLGIIIAIAGLYYIASLIVKKQPNFSKMVGISAISIVPTIVASLIISPIVSLIYSPLGMCVTLIGSIYSILIMYEVMNNEIGLEGNVKIYFNLICISILGIAAYYLLMNVLLNSVSSSIGNIFSLFN